MKIDILSKRYWYFIFSLILIVPGLVLLAVKGMPYGIDFTGGTMMELQFSQGNRPEREAFENEIINYGIDATVVLSGENNVIIRAPYIEDSEIEKLIAYATKQYG